MSNVALNKSIMEDSINNPRNVTDGNVKNYDNHSGFAYFRWPGWITLDLENNISLRCIRFLLWDGLGNDNDKRYPMNYSYRLLVSKDNINWDVIHDSCDNALNGWQVFNFNPTIEVRYIRIHGMYNTVFSNPNISIVQIEAYDTEPEVLDAQVILNRTISKVEDIDVIEHSDGLPITNKIKEMINKLSALISSESNILNPDLINEIISNLKLKVNDISSIENNMESIRREIINPVATNLAKSKKISIGSLVVGIIGGVIGIISIIYNIITNG